VERLWRDVTRCVSSSFNDVFHILEAEAVLDPLNEVNIFCLHFIFLPHINRCLTDFRGNWNNHPLSSEGNMSPLQLFTEGLLLVDQCETPEPSNGNGDVELTNEEESETVQVPSTKFLPCKQLSTELMTSINLSYESIEMGKQLFSTSIQLVGYHLLNGCLDCKLE